MSPIARVFIVINLILSVAFVALAGKYLGEAQSWKVEHDKVVKAKNEELQAKDDVINKLKADNKVKSEDYITANSAKMELENQNKSLSERIKEGKATNQQYHKELGQLSAGMTKMNTTIDNFRSENSSLRTKEKEAVSARESAENEKLALEQQVQDLERDIEKLNEKISGNLTTIGNLESKVDQQNTIITIAKSKGFDVTGAMPTIAAKVVDVRPELKVVTLSVGKDDGVKKGFTFDIYRDGVYKARVQVVEVDEKLCIARIEMAKATVTKGDSAKTNL